MDRRAFLKQSGLASLYLSLPAWLTACSQQNLSQTATQTLAQPTAWVTATASPLTTEATSLLHLLNRVTYGPRPGELARVQAIGWDAFLEQQLHPEQIDDSLLDGRLAQFPTLTMSNAQLLQQYPRGAKGAKGPQQIVNELNTASLLRAVHSERQLLEVMVDFWSNHLHVSISKGRVKWFKTTDDRDVIRKHAFGKFSDMLVASAKSPAMLFYLDNVANVVPGAKIGRQKVGGLNENYAREVMELHTVGVEGGYSHADITTVARVLTGWTLQRKPPNEGEYVFAPFLHDTGAKQIAFLNLELPAGGDEREGEYLLRVLAKHPLTAERIAYKLCHTFVADAPFPTLVQQVAQAYLQHDTELRPVLRFLFNTPEFRSADQPKVKLPLRMLVSAVRALGAQVADVGADIPRKGIPLSQLLSALGQQFFAWSAPNGYPQSGEAWLTTTGMLSRWNAAFALSEQRINGVSYDLSTFLPDMTYESGAIVEQLCSQLYLPLPEETQAALVTFLSDNGNAETKLDQQQAQPLVSAALGLLLASPAFQIY